MKHSSVTGFGSEFTSLTASWMVLGEPEAPGPGRQPEASGPIRDSALDDDDTGVIDGVQFVNATTQITRAVLPIKRNELFFNVDSRKHLNRPNALLS